MKPVGNITRGTTAPNRLRRIDRWLLEVECGPLRELPDPTVVDLGFGASPVTTWELRNRLQQHVRPDLKVVGIEIDQERVTAAAPLADETLSFIRGGFEIPTPAPVAVIRAANVLRQYEESEVVPAWQRLVSRLQPAGLLIDATCDEIGRRACWIAVRRGDAGEPLPVSLTISTHLQSLETPSDVAARLPKSLIHRNLPGERVHALLSALDDAWLRTSAAATFGPRQHWLATVEYATAHGLTVLDSKSRWRLGELTVPWAAVAPS